MKKLLLFIFTSFNFAGLTAQEIKEGARIEILDSIALEVINPDAAITVIAKGFQWTEGPLYVAAGDYLLFSDIPQNTVFKLDASGKLTEFVKPSGYLGDGTYGDEPGSNGLLLSPDGELVLMQHGERQVAKMAAPLESPKASFVPLVSKFEGKKFNSPNDGVYDQQGNLYFTDPPYGLPQKMEDPNKELDYQGLFCLKTSGETVLVDELSRPNGVALSVDEDKLYVAVSNPEKAVWWVYDILGTGNLINKKVFYDATKLVGKEGQQGLPDGMKMHSKGFLFATGPGGIWVFDSNKPVARIYTGENTANCAFDAKEKRLFMTADDYVLQLNLK